MATTDHKPISTAAFRSVLVVVTALLVVACTGRDARVGTLSTEPPSSEEHSETETADAREVSMVDTLALVPADNGCFNVALGDLNTFRAAFDLPVPTTDTSEVELTEQIGTIAPLLAFGPPLTLADFGGDRSILVPLARSSAYIVNFDRTTEVFVGDFASDTFGPLPPDDVLDGVNSLPVPDVIEEGFGSERLVVDNGVVTVASTPDDLATTLAVQHGEVDTLADVPDAVELVSALDDLDVMHGGAENATSALIHGNAWGVAADPDNPGSWLLHLLFRPRDNGGLDALTSTIAERVGTAAEQHDADVVDVALRDGYVLATIGFTEPRGWFDIESELSPILWDEIATDLDAAC
jgi:hypothetical protein